MSNKLVIFGGSDRRTGTSTLAYSLFRRLAANEPDKSTLYIDLSEDSGIAGYLGVKYSTDIDDLVVLASSNRLESSDIKECSIEVAKNAWFLPGTSLSYRHSIAEKSRDVGDIIDKALEVFDFTVVEVGTGIKENIGEQLKSIGVPLVIVTEQDYKLLAKTKEVFEGVDENNRLIIINKFRDDIHFTTKDMTKEIPNKAILEMGFNTALVNNTLVGKFKEEVIKNNTLDTLNKNLMQAMGIEDKKERRGLFGRLWGGRKK